MIPLRISKVIHVNQASSVEDTSTSDTHRCQHTVSVTKAQGSICIERVDEPKKKGKNNYVLL